MLRDCPPTVEVVRPEGDREITPLDHDALSSLPELIMTRGETEATTTRELWHGLWTFLLVVAALTAEWSLRRTWGM